MVNPTASAAHTAPVLETNYVNAAAVSNSDSADGGFSNCNGTPLVISSAALRRAEALLSPCKDYPPLMSGVPSPSSSRWAAPRDAQLEAQLDATQQAPNDAGSANARIAQASTTPSSGTASISRGWLHSGFNYCSSPPASSPAAATAEADTPDTLPAEVSPCSGAAESPAATCATTARGVVVGGVIDGIASSNHANHVLSATSASFCALPQNKAEPPLEAEVVVLSAVAQAHPRGQEGTWQQQQQPARQLTAQKQQHQEHQHDAQRRCNAGGRCFAPPPRGAASVSATSAHCGSVPAAPGHATATALSSSLPQPSALSSDAAIGNGNTNSLAATPPGANTSSPQFADATKLLASGCFGNDRHVEIERAELDASTTATRAAPHHGETPIPREACTPQLQRKRKGVKSGIPTTEALPQAPCSAAAAAPDSRTGATATAASLSARPFAPAAGAAAAPLPPQPASVVELPEFVGHEASLAADSLLKVDAQCASPVSNAVACSSSASPAAAWQSADSSSRRRGTRQCASCGTCRTTLWRSPKVSSGRRVTVLGETHASLRLCVSMGWPGTCRLHLCAPLLKTSSAQSKWCAITWCQRMPLRWCDAFLHSRASGNGQCVVAGHAATVGRGHLL
jgi:hypothetical protein